MNSTASRVLLVLVIIVLAAGAGFWFGHRHGGEGKEAEGEHDAPTTAAAEEKKAVVDVVVAPLERGTIIETITAYGSVVAQPGDVRILSVPLESRVRKIRVTAGQQVSPDTPVIDVEPSPTELAALAEAKTTLSLAERDLKQVEQRLADHLATNVELSAAQQVFQLAKIKLDSLTQRGVGTGASTLKAEASGIVNKIDAQEGGVVPAGAPLIEIVSGNRVEAALGVEPSDVMSLRPGQRVKLRTVDRATTQPLDGQIRLIGQRVDPASRLANVIVTLPPDAHLMLETYVAGDIVKSTADALIVPRQAVLPEEGGEHVLYTVKDGKAVKHSLRLGLENQRQTQVIADDLKEGDAVIIEGNYALEDGTAVTTREAPARTAGEPSASATTTKTTTSPTPAEAEK